MVTSITFPLLSLFTLLAVSSAFAPLRIARRSHPPLQSKSNEWNAADDWASLSDDNNPVDTSTIFNVDLARDAALEMGKSQVDDDARDPEDVFVFDAVDSIINPMPDGTDPPLYDTASSFENYVETQSFIDDAGKEIGLLVRCNESPEDLLVSEGRALPPLTDEERYDPAQLVNISIEKGQPVIEPTTFLSNAAAVMFQEHAVLQKGRDDGPVLDAGAVAKWMSKSLNESVGRHDKRVLSVISRYGLYGSGVLQEPEFESLYMDAVASGLDRQMSAVTLKGNGPKRQKAMMKQLRMDQPGIQSVWRDLSNHGISSPVEMKREKEETEIEQKYGKRASTADAGQTIMDECEILGWDEHDYSSTYFNIEDEGNDLATSKKKGSHVNVELSSDSMTPKRIRDGQFVFIDEESCIGCAMCAQIAPSAFVMLDSGRARAYSQSNSPEVVSAVSSCPVSCMHNCAFHELKEFELGRDEGDGRTDHRHFGTSRGHTPLNVAGIDSDANHKSSWHHYLKQKCHVSSACPKRGCYDCPKFSAPGENPYFKELHQMSEHIRAQDFIASGEADVWRKTVDL